MKTNLYLLIGQMQKLIRRIYQAIYVRASVHLIGLLLYGLMQLFSAQTVGVGLTAYLAQHTQQVYAGACDGDYDVTDTDDYINCGGTPPANAPAQNNPADGPLCTGGDPVDCYSGIFMHERRDLYVRDVIPLTVSRTYRSQDSLGRSFGVGTSLSYDMFLTTDFISYIDLIQPDGARIHYTCTDHVCNALSTVDKTYAGSVFSFWPDFKLRLKNGTTMSFAHYVLNNPHSAGLQSLTDRYGNTVHFTRDTSGNLTQVTSPNGRHINFTYDTGNRIKTASDDGGRVVNYYYNANGTLQSVKDPLGYSESYTYDPTTLNMLTVTDKRNNVMVTNTYYSGTGTPLDGRVKQQTYADNSTNNFNSVFNGDGSLAYTDVTDERKMVRRSLYDGAGHTVQVVYALGQPEQNWVTMVRDAVTNDVIQEIDSLGRFTNFTYDQNGNVQSKTLTTSSQPAITTSYTWDTLFNVMTSMTDALGNTTSFQYDTLSNLIETDDPLGHKTTRTYNDDGQVKTISTYPATGKVLTTNFSYQNGDLIGITDPLNRTTSLEIDALGRVNGVRDAAGQLWSTTYDAMDQVTQRCDPAGNCANQTFDGNGNLTRFVKGTTQRDFTYDSRNRLATEGRGTTVERALSYPVDYLHTTLTEASGRSETVTLDILGRSKHSVLSTGGTSPTQRTLDYTWDNQSRLSTLIDSSVGTFSYHYDDRFDQIASETGPTGTVSYSYDADGRRATLSPSGGTVVSYQYDNASRLSSLTEAAGTGTAQPASALNVGMNYDNANRRQTINLPNGMTLAYTWDDGSQLTGLNWSQGATAVGGLTYGYNTLGQRNSITGSFARMLGGTPLNLAVGSDGRISSENAVTVIHDANGRLIQDAQYKYVWNELGLLQEIHTLSNNNLIASFKYDAFGRRYASTISGLTIQYLHEGNNPIQIQNASGTPTENLLAGGIDEWYARTTAGQSQIYLTDALGSTIGLTDTQGNKLVDYTYSPYGVSSNDNASSTNRFQYAGRENDGFGLYYNRARFYKPTWGRFASQDPIGLDGGDSLYAYTSGNPLSYVDPLGLQNGDWWDPRTYLPDYDKAKEIAAEELAIHQGHNDADDAQRHAEWSNRMENEIGPFTAWSSGVGHEIDGLINNHQPLDEALMDLHNNSEGRRAASEGRPIDPNKLRINPKDRSGCY